MTDKNGVMQCKGKNIIEVTEIGKYIDYAVVISVITPRYREEILEILYSFSGQVYLDLSHLVLWASSGSANPLQSIDLAIKTHKKIYLYGRKNGMTDFWEMFLGHCGMSVSGYVNRIGNVEHNVKSIYDLAFEGTEDKLILLNVECPESLIRAREEVELAGFSLEKVNYTCFQWHTRATERILDKLHEYHDPLVGGSILYNQGKPGWKVYGNENKEHIKILVLGGSTSSEEFYIENWVSKLYYKLKRKGIQTVIYNGAHAANDIVDELLRLLRDGNVLNPHIVISMSGVNNLYYKDGDNQFNPERVINWVKSYDQYCSGVFSTESLYHFWIRNENLLKLVTEFLGACFFCFLQPMNITMEHMSLREKRLYEQERRMEGAACFRELARDGEDYIKLMNLFEHQDDMFFDLCHYTDRAQEIIADKVCEVIEPVLYALGQKGNGQEEAKYEFRNQ